MKLLSRRNGFSLVELLTVIAIIAILASIIFPVMGVVKDRANQSNCMANLKQIAIGVQMFKTDNRKCPDILGAEVMDTSGNKWVPGAPVQRFESAKGAYLFNEYVKTIALFHCKASWVSSSSDTLQTCKVPYDKANTTVYLYAYDSYDAGLLTVGGSQPYANTEPHYTVDWANSVTGNSAGSVGFLKPYPSNTPDTPQLQQEDYARQLKWRNPPGDTVVTWCTCHENSPSKGSVLVVYLDGHTDRVEAADMTVCAWRVQPKKS